MGKRLVNCLFARRCSGPPDATVWLRLRRGRRHAFWHATVSLAVLRFQAELAFRKHR